MPKTIPQDWISIPYGKALKNQAYRVVDELGRNCPNYVMGELLIGGVGVAKGYYGDRELTVKKFFKKDGIRWYKTGDNGRTWDDGTIEFLGRKDTQVKIKCHRIELGEIEDAILGEIKRLFVKCWGENVSHPNIYYRTNKNRLYMGGIIFLVSKTTISLRN